MHQRLCTACAIYSLLYTKFEFTQEKSVFSDTEQDDTDKHRMCQSRVDKEMLELGDYDQ